MNKSNLKLMSLITTVAMAAGFIACTPEEEPAPAPQITPAIELTEPGQAVIMIPAGSLEPVTVGFTTEAAIEDLVIENVKEADWCTAEFEGTGTIKITPNQLRLKETASAEFAVANPKDEYSKAVTILVTRGGATILERRPVEFLNEEDRNIVITPGSVEEYVFGIKANFHIEELVLSGESDWCKAEFVGENQIKVTPSETGRLEDKEATFTVKGKDALTKGVTIKVPGSISFKVSRAACPVQKMDIIDFGRKDLTFSLAPMSTGVELLNGTLNFPIEGITVKSVGEPDWCTAKVVERGFEVTTTRAEEMEDLEATFEISYPERLDLGHVIYEPVTQTVKVIKPKKPQEPFLELSGEGLTWSPDGYYIFQGNPNGGSVEITIHTNQPKWYYTDLYMTEWLTATPQEGVDGDVLTLTYPANTSGTQIAAYPYIEYEKYTYQGQMLVVMIPAL